MQTLTRLVLALLLALPTLPTVLPAQEVQDAPRVVLKGVPFDLTVQGAEGGPALSIRVEDATGQVDRPGHGGALRHGDAPGPHRQRP